MTAVFVTVDTELSALLHQRGMSGDANFASSMLGQTPAGEFGIGWQMDVLDRFGLRGVYFVDPMPAMVLGDGPIARTVELVLARGHEVQLHLHSEWLEWAKDPPVAGRGQNIGDFSLEDQRTVIGWARDTLVRCGAPSPTAFRAGNYGANDDTLRVLAEMGLAWDSSFNGAYTGRGCAVSLDAGQVDPVPHCGLTELPISGIWDRPGSLRPAQVCALSSAEMRAGLAHAAETQRPVFMIVTHSFEMLSRDRQRPNRAVMRRFESMARMIAQYPTLHSTGFNGLTLEAPATPPSRAAASTTRTLTRYAQQAVATWLYERRLRPA